MKNIKTVRKYVKLQKTSKIHTFPCINIQKLYILLVIPISDPRYSNQSSSSKSPDILGSFDQHSVNLQNTQNICTSEIVGHRLPYYKCSN